MTTNKYVCVCVCVFSAPVTPSYPPSLHPLFREVVKKLFALLSSAVRRRKTQRRLRDSFMVECAWKSHLNFSVAQAHVTLLHQSLKKQNGGATQHRSSSYHTDSEVSDF